MSAMPLDTTGLSNDQLLFIQGIINLLKTPSKKEEVQARKDLQKFWKKIETVDIGLTEKESAELVEEAIAWARDKA